MKPSIVGISEMVGDTEENPVRDEDGNEDGVTEE